MAEEFDHGGVCGGTSCYWNPSINLFRPSPCHYFTMDDVRTCSSISDASDSGSHGGRGVCSSIILLGNMQNPKHPTQSENLSIDDWNHQFLNGNERSEENYPDMNFPQMDHPTVPLELQQTYADSLIATNTALINSPPSNDDYSALFPKLMIDADFQAMQFLTEDDKEAAANSAEALPNSQFVDDNTVTFWNSMAAASDDVWTTFSASIQPEIIPSNIVHIAKTNVKDHEEFPDLATEAKKQSSEPPIKRPRIDTPSHLPVFKLRKEKLGDRITALQQLVSPFGKTDTASVLHEAIEYIKFLHDQVNALCASSLKDGSPPQIHHLQAANHKLKGDEEGGIGELKDRGLCLVPVSSIFPAAEPCNADMYTTPFGGSFW